MPRPWSDERKKRLAALQAAGRSADEIAKALGLRRDQVIARIELMASWERNRAMYDKALEERAQAQDARAQKAIATMKKAIARGMARNEAMFQANLARDLARDRRAIRNFCSDGGRRGAKLP
jgi:hypothetical protein